MNRKFGFASGLVAARRENWDDDEYRLLEEFMDTAHSLGFDWYSTKTDGGDLRLGVKTSAEKNGKNVVIIDPQAAGPVLTVKSVGGRDAKNGWLSDAHLKDILGDHGYVADLRSLIGIDDSRSGKWPGDYIGAEEQRASTHMVDEKENFLVNIGNAETKSDRMTWWRENVVKSMLTAGYGNQPGDKGYKGLTKFAAGDRLFAYISEVGIVGMGFASGSTTYELEDQPVAPEYSTHQHRVGVDWQFAVNDEASAIPISDLRELGLVANQALAKMIELDVADILTTMVESQMGLIETDRSTKTSAKAPATLTEIEAPEAALFSEESPNSGRGRRGNFQTDHIGKAVKNKALGDKGESAVIEYEKRRLIEAGERDLADKIKHVAQSDDGAGYDIDSFTEAGDPLRIEVKTTTGGPNSAFFLSANELATCEEDAESYRLARVCHFDVATNSGQVFMIDGERLTTLARTPTAFRVFPNRLSGS